MLGSGWDLGWWELTRRAQLSLRASPGKAGSSSGQEAPGSRAGMEGAGQGWREQGRDVGAAGRTQPGAASGPRGGRTFRALGKSHCSAFSSSSGKQMQLSPVAGKADWGYLFEALSGGCGGRRGRGPRCGEFRRGSKRCPNWGRVRGSATGTAGTGATPSPPKRRAERS